MTAAGGLDSGRATVDAEKRLSQFASAALLVAPYARWSVVLTAERLGAAAYVELTAELMERFGAAGGAGRPGRPGRSRPATPYQATGLVVEYDASAAATCSTWPATGGQVTVTNATPGTLRPDAAVVDLLAAMGATVTRDGQALTVRGPATLGPVDADLAGMLDQVTTVAALALAAAARGCAGVRRSPAGARPTGWPPWPPSWPSWAWPSPSCPTGWSWTAPARPAPGPAGHLGRPPHGHGPGRGGDQGAG